MLRIFLAPIANCGCARRVACTAEGCDFRVSDSTCLYSICASPPSTFNGPRSPVSSQRSTGCAPVAMSKKAFCTRPRTHCSASRQTPTCTCLEAHGTHAQTGKRHETGARGADTDRDRGRHGQGISAQVLTQHRRISGTRNRILAVSYVGAMDHPRITGGLPQGQPRAPGGLSHGLAGFGDGVGPVVPLRCLS